MVLQVFFVEPTLVRSIDCRLIPGWRLGWHGRCLCTRYSAVTPAGSQPWQLFEVPDPVPDPLTILMRPAFLPGGSGHNVGPRSTNQHSGHQTTNL